MKILLLLLISGIMYGQDKHTQTIYVTGTTIERVHDALLDAGYNIERQDVNTVSTVATPVKKGVSMVLYVHIKDSTAIITGKWNMPAAAGSNNIFVYSLAAYQVIEYTKAKSSIAYHPWVDMNAFAALVGGVVSYANPSNLVIK